MTRSTLLSLLFALVAACGGGGNAHTGTTPTGGGSKISAANVSYTTGDQVVEASIAAQGGRDRFAKLTGMRQTGKVTIEPMNLNGTFTAIAAPPRKTVTLVEIPGIGSLREGVSGDLAWDVNPLTGARILAGPEKATQLREATFNSEVNWKELYKTDLVGVVDWNGMKAYKVVFTALDNGDKLTRYYAQDTLLPAGFEQSVKTQMGTVDLTMIESDYRDVDGMKLAHKLVRKDAGQTMTIAVEKYELSPQIEPTTFDPPPEITALTKKSS